MTIVYRIGNVGRDSVAGETTFVLQKTGTIAAGGVANLINVTSNYRVTAGKTFYPARFIVIFSAAIATSVVPITMIYADDSALTTNIVSLANFPTGGFTVGTYVFDIYGVPSVPATKYIGLQNNSASSIASTRYILEGFES